MLPPNTAGDNSPQTDHTGAPIKRFEELSHQQTRLGELTLRRRQEPVTDSLVYEVKLGEEFLMSSLFTVAEIALADLAIDQHVARSGSTALSVLVGGLGLGYTAVAALRHSAVTQLDVVEALEPVIAWHRDRLLPTSEELMDDSRTRLHQADFFAMVTGDATSSLDRGADPAAYDVVLVDIDHAPDFVLHESHQSFYSQSGLSAMREFVSPGGVFALWSDNPPDPTFTAHLGTVFSWARAEVVSFANPLTRGTSHNSVYLAVR
ncbi:MAG: spermidine synthase [Ornithinimicrobium sp.]